MGEQGEQLQRSVTSFRRQGSSGSVWDDKFLAGLWDQSQNQKQQDEQSQSQSQSQPQPRPRPQSESSGTMLERSRSGGGARQHERRTVTVAPPSNDPPSPKVPTCGLCGFFAKSNNNPKVKKRR
ncbi:hypothetical protein HN51_057532 [Arachis hypogaea]|uniref:uncharacterized protein At1g15400 n=1 Tax=Arachis ipaensis TaxID=130454 RepID=UPI0007AF8B4D|nr:uncharacterized protein At1g15400 [Arachis ipaensis]XP_025685943.1 uncharacterized protein At1g15400 [Arachis hypogaea]QHN80600.1 uncharacterized protein DS421_20g679600 [Arachis hypogaea]